MNLGEGPAQGSIASREAVTRNRLGEARHLVKALGTAAVEDLATAAPPIGFVRGLGTVTFARLDNRCAAATKGGVVLHTQLHSRTGQRVDLCPFGSMDHISGFALYDNFSPGWSSSAEPAVHELLRRRGTHHIWFGEEDLAYKALQIALCQGVTGSDEEHAGRPESRGFTLGECGGCEFFAEVYTDVVLSPGRRRFRGGHLLSGTERIMVGHPCGYALCLPGRSYATPSCAALIIGCFGACCDVVAGAAEQYL
ncbi:hypothetical protein AB0B21_32950 [Streptomyces rimosus]|uniref:hypothetical protein n=1 Tax=Streptomyces rimosus TaxID=1927 RepID=UPI000518FA89|nr:hypothetical protein [Streptomyces rimosus]